MAQKLKNIAIRTSALYALFAGLWILLSDRVISLLSKDPLILTQLQTYKGLFFVVATTVLLYILLHTQLHRWRRDAREKQEAQQALTASNDYLKAVLDSTNDAILVIDAKIGKIIDTNQRLFEIIGYTYDEVIRKPVSQLQNIVPGYSIEKMIVWAKTAKLNAPQSLEWQIKQKNGAPLWVEINLRFVVIGGQDRFVVSVRDIQSKKETENSLKENQRRLATLISNLPGMVYRCKNDPDWTIEYVSEGVFTLTGYRAKDMMGQNNITFRKIIHPEDRQIVWDEVQDALRSYRSYAFAYRMVDVSNIERWVWEQGRGIFDDQNQLLFLEGFITDISEQKRAEQETREINTRLSVLINATPDIICFKNGQNRWLEANAADLALFNLTDVDYRGKTDAELADFTNPIYREAFLACERSDEAAWQRKTISRAEETIPTLDGGYKIYDVIKAPIFSDDETRKGLIVFGRDITERKKAEEQLRISQETYQGILGSITETVYVQDQNGVFLDVNLAAQTMYGYNREELIGRTPEFLSAPGRNNLEKIKSIVDSAYRGEPQQFDFWGIKKNGDVFPKEVSLTQGWYFGKKAIIAVARDITARKLAEQVLYKRLAELEALRTIDRAITSSFDLQITLDILIKQAIHKLDVDAAAILIMDPDSQDLKYIISHGFRYADLETVQIRPGQGFAGQIMLEQRLLQVTDQQAIENDKAFAKGNEFSAYYGVPLIAKGQIKGILEIFRRTDQAHDPNWMNFLETLANQTAIAIDNSQMFDILQYKNLELAFAYDATITGWARALELREGESSGHSERITELTIELAKELGLSKNALITIRQGVLLHDVGKMGIPDKILLKKGKLTRNERKIIEQHPNISYEMLSKIDYLRQALAIPHYHHEKWDGTGYPDGLIGQQIPQAARIFAIIDVWDALTNDRPYRKAWSHAEALEYIRQQSGKHFDPEITDSFLKLRGRESQGF